MISYLTVDIVWLRSAGMQQFQVPSGATKFLPDFMDIVMKNEDLSGSGKGSFIATVMHFNLTLTFEQNLLRDHFEAALFPH